MASRTARAVSGTALNVARSRAGISTSGRGWIHGGVRWNTVRCAACAAISGTNWIADAPVPITATRWPVRSQEGSHRAEWNEAPPNTPAPGMSGYEGRCSAPAADTTARAW